MPKVSSDTEAPKALNYIEKLVAELCPGGVEYVELSKLLNYEQPGKYTVSSTNYDDSYSTPVLTAGKTFILGYTDEVDGIYAASKKDPVIIFDDFTTAFKWVDFNFKIKSTAIKLLTSYNSNTSLKYIYYAMQCIKYETQDHARQWISNYSKFLIPLPPVEVQNAIVEILDKFTKLEAELEAELAARRAQYEYYRKLLLEDITNRVSVERVELSEIFDISNGYTPKKSVSSYWDDGNVPWFRMEDIRRNGRVLSESLIKVHESAVKKSGLFPENSIIVATSATIGEHALIKIPFLCNQRFTALVLKEKYINKLDRKFLFYYCFVLDEWCRNNTTQSSFASVDMKGFRKFVFPVPSLTDQERIVSILDTFDALVNDISSGLPAELEARRKQYEYYRDRLLTFPRKFEPAEQAMQR